MRALTYLDALERIRQLRVLFAGCHGLWEPCGWVRRRRAEGPPPLVHVVVPRPAPSTSTFDNALWQRAAELIDVGDLAITVAPEQEHVVLDVELDGVAHRLVRTHEDALGPRLAQHTGPEDYWLRLLFRLGAAGTLRMNRGMVCAIDRSGAQESNDPIACPDERTFFKLARTRWKPPWDRWPQKQEGKTPEWQRGMLAEWYPAGARVYASPDQRELFDTAKPADPRYVGKDRERWTKS